MLKSPKVAASLVSCLRKNVLGAALNSDKRSVTEKKIYFYLRIP